MPAYRRPPPAQSRCCQARRSDGDRAPCRPPRRGHSGIERGPALGPDDVQTRLWTVRSWAVRREPAGRRRLRALGLEASVLAQALGAGESVVARLRIRRWIRGGWPCARGPGPPDDRKARRWRPKVMMYRTVGAVRPLGVHSTRPTHPVSSLGGRRRHLAKRWPDEGGRCLRLILNERTQLTLTTATHAASNRGIGLGVKAASMRA